MPMTVTQIRAQLPTMSVDQATTALGQLQHVLATAEGRRDRGSADILRAAAGQVQARLRELQEPAVPGAPEVTVAAELGEGSEVSEPPHGIPYWTVPNTGAQVTAETSGHQEEVPTEAPAPKRKKRKRRKRTVKTNG